MSDLEWDPRITVARGDLAADTLEGQVKADRYCAGSDFQVAHGLTNLQSFPEEKSATSSQLLYGEIFTVYDIQNGWAWLLVFSMVSEKSDRYTTTHCTGVGQIPECFQTCNHQSH